MGSRFDRGGHDRVLASDLGEPGTAFPENTSTMAAEEVAEAECAAFRNDRTLVVPGWPDKIGVVLVRFTPRPVSRASPGGEIDNPLRPVP